MRNKKTMNCERCGKTVSLRTAGEVEKERSDLDGALCIVAMWCKRCTANREKLRSAKLQQPTRASRH